MSDIFTKIFMELFESVSRQGPGSFTSTRRALSFCSGLGQKPKILDIGCGTGAQSLFLAKETGGEVVCVDNHEPFLKILQQKSKKAGIAKQIRTELGDMNSLPFQEENFDLIWSEGAVYLMGFDNGLNNWRPFLKTGGYLAVSELSWFTTERPVEAETFWRENYPQMRSIEDNSSAVEKAGYELLSSFCLPDTDWTDCFYKELKEQVDELEKKYPDIPEARAVIDLNRVEMELFSKYSSNYGYVFYVARKR